jgi:hypothetical protein
VKKSLEPLSALRNIAETAKKNGFIPLQCGYFLPLAKLPRVATEF